MPVPLSCFLVNPKSSENILVAAPPKAHCFVYCILIGVLIVDATEEMIGPYSLHPCSTRVIHYKSCASVKTTAAEAKLNAQEAFILNNVPRIVACVAPQVH